MALPHSPSNASRLSITPCTTEHALHMCSQTMRAPSMSGSCVMSTTLSNLRKGVAPIFAPSPACVLAITRLVLKVPYVNAVFGGPFGALMI